MSGQSAGDGWVSEHFGVRLHTSPDSPQPMSELVSLALRRNPKRAHLLVSGVLGKHVPTEPRVVHAAAARLGRLVGERLDGQLPVVVGNAETATGLGHVVAETLAGYCLHSTRRVVDGLHPVAGYQETHSHATSHLLLPEDPEALAGDEPLVLVDDELSTGNTALNTIAELGRTAGRSRYVIATLADLRSAADRERMARFASDRGIRLEVVALGSGWVELPPGFAESAAAFVAATPAATPAARSAVSSAGPRRPPRCVPASWPQEVRDGGRHGLPAAQLPAVRAAAAATARAIAPGLHGDRVLVLGFEELMYAPLLIALELGDLARPGATVRYSSTSRSPVLALDVPGYPIRTALTFPAHDDPADGPGSRYAYNVAAAQHAQPFSDIVLVVDQPAATERLHQSGGLLAQLAACTDQVHLVVLPSYRPGAS